MKKKNLNIASKLQLLKETISPLTNNQQSAIYGGDGPTRTAPTTTEPPPRPTVPPPPPTPTVPDPIPDTVNSGATCTILTK